MPSETNWYSPLFGAKGCRRSEPLYMGCFLVVLEYKCYKRKTSPERPYHQILFLIASRGSLGRVELGRANGSLFFHSPKDSIVVLVASSPGLHIVVVVIHDAFAAFFYLDVVPAQLATSEALWSLVWEAINEACPR